MQFQTFMVINDISMTKRSKLVPAKCYALPVIFVNAASLKRRLLNKFNIQISELGPSRFKTFSHESFGISFSKMLQEIASNYMIKVLVVCAI